MDTVVTPLLNIAVALLLSLIIGTEREFFAKAAGMRTYTLVGMGSALFTVVSKYGFLETPTGAAATDGSRIAAQVVTGIGFLGAGVIFVRREAVKGLTTAAGIWFVAAVGMAAASGLYLVAGVATGLYLLVMVGMKPLAARLPHARSSLGTFAIVYEDGRGILRVIVECVAQHGLKVTDLHVMRNVDAEGKRAQEVSLELQGSGSAMEQLAHDLSGIDGVLSVKRSLNQE